jgi:hypothetical protein
MGLETYSSLVDLMVSLKGYRSLLEVRFLSHVSLVSAFLRSHLIAAEPLPIDLQHLQGPPLGLPGHV